MGQAVPSLSVLARDEVPSLLGTGIRVEGLSSREVSCPKPICSVISEHDEELQESPMVMVSTRASLEEQDARHPCVPGETVGVLPCLGKQPGPQKCCAHPNALL